MFASYFIGGIWLSICLLSLSHHVGDLVKAPQTASACLGCCVSTDERASLRTSKMVKAFRWHGPSLVGCLTFGSSVLRVDRHLKKKRSGAWCQPLTYWAIVKFRSAKLLSIILEGQAHSKMGLSRSKLGQLEVLAAASIFFCLRKANKMTKITPMKDAKVT